MDEEVEVVVPLLSDNEEEVVVVAIVFDVKENEADVFESCDGDSFTAWLAWSDREEERGFFFGSSVNQPGFFAPPPTVEN
tara:strand:+ start:343 stop:582 length:240 start_codon:yes stop_codon:yes gene_type:complete